MLGDGRWKKAEHVIEHKVAFENENGVKKWVKIQEVPGRIGYASPILDTSQSRGNEQKTDESRFSFVDSPTVAFPSNAPRNILIV